jgi:hypothetical protein
MTEALTTPSGMSDGPLVPLISTRVEWVHIMHPLPYKQYYLFEVAMAIQCIITAPLTQNGTIPISVSLTEWLFLSTAKNVIVSQYIKGT